MSVNKLSVFIDFFNFVPYIVKKYKNNSSEMFYVMTSNTKGGVSFD